MIAAVLGDNDVCKTRVISFTAPSSPSASSIASVTASSVLAVSVLAVSPPRRRRSESLADARLAARATRALVERTMVSTRMCAFTAFGFVVVVARRNIASVDV
jgi:hypothetical protein